MALTRRAFAMTSLALPMLIGKSHASASITQGTAFGSTWRLVTAWPLSASAQAGIVGIIAQVDEQMSPYRADSDLSRFNAYRGNQRYRAPEAFCAVTHAALEMAHFTGGAFDPTVGPAVQRFGFGPIEGRTGRYQNIYATSNALQKHDPDLTLDLCGIAKGYTLDRITLALLDEGVEDFTLELGGEVRTQGLHPAGRGWRIAIEDPTSDTLQARFVVMPGERALATSGHRANGLSGPITTSHIIDPRSQLPVDPYAASVSVLADTAMQADALATALAAMGPQGPVFAQAHDVSALFLLASPAPQAHVVTGSFAAHILV